MPNKILYSKAALKDLDSIWNYIESDLCNPIAAEHTITGIMDKIDTIATFPGSGAKLVFDNELDSGYHFVVYHHHLAFYRIKENQTVYVDRVLYGGQDYLKILFPEIPE